ncbi:hypothetical protein BCR35DRAFT_146171 [Leucosporidium creatinivorum]|uniref:Uncharacterized protein n=1 Tax=Leucosporidium creatinivorum TaxID=106004 RepID=A0A1Y2ERW7_9BASI|nr:hypothetical protein BCR35DRAFT_146171 [Leucosporidium creatinivorum]
MDIYQYMYILTLSLFGALRDCKGFALARSESSWQVRAGNPNSRPRGLDTQRGELVAVSFSIKNREQILEQKGCNRTRAASKLDEAPHSDRLSRQVIEAQRISRTAEKARIEKLRDEGKGTRRPNLLKRLSSGVEMGNWRPGNASPSKSGRGRGDSITEGTAA